MKTFHIATAAAAATLSSLPSTITAQQQDEVDPSFASIEPITCSCTPNSYTFQLNFDGSCVDSTIGTSDGVDGSICFYTEGGTPEELDAQNVLAPPSRRLLGSSILGNVLDLFSSRGNNNDGRRNDENEWMDRALSNVDFTRQLQHAQLLAVNDKNDNVELGRYLQDAPLDTVVTTITSVTFLETDTTPALNIINQDSTYFEISGTDGQLLEYVSVSSRLDPTAPLSDQVNDVPGGVILVLFGVNAANEVIQNRVAWGYARNYCDEVPLSPGAEVGWVTLESFDPPYSAFCDGVTDAPTVSPDPVITTSQTTTTEATTIKPDDGDWGGSGGSKATKSPTTEVVKSKSSKALFSKGSKSAVDAKAQKAKTDSASSKATKKEALFKHESKTGKASSDDSSTSKTSKVADAKAGKHSSGDDSSSAKGSDKSPSTKAEKQAAWDHDAKAEKVPTPPDAKSEKDSTKSATEKGSGKPAKGKGMSMPPKKVKDPSKTGSAKMAKTGKASTSSSDTAATPSDAKADKQLSPSDTSMHGGKATKVFKSSKGSKAAGDESSKAKSSKATAEKPAKGESSSSDSTSDAKAGKESTSDKSSKSGSGKPTKGMSMPKTTPSSKTDKGHTETKPENIDAKAKKEGSAKAEKAPSHDSPITTPLLKHTKSSKAMSVPAKSSSSSKTSKTTTGKASKATADAKAEKATHPEGWVASAKADKINTTNGYRVIVKKPVRD